MLKTPIISILNELDTIKCELHEERPDQLPVNASLVSIYNISFQPAIEIFGKFITKLCVASFTDIAEKEYYYLLFEDEFKEEQIYQIFDNKKYFLLIAEIIDAGGFVENINSFDRKPDLNFWIEFGYDFSIRRHYENKIYPRVVEQFKTLLPTQCNQITVLEVGCGNGYVLTECYREAIKKSNQVLAIGIDPNVMKLTNAPMPTITDQDHIHLYRGLASEVADILDADYTPKELGKVIGLFCGFNTYGVVSGTREALENIRTIYPYIDALIWTGASCLACMHKMLVPNFNIRIASYASNPMGERLIDGYILEKKSLSDKLIDYRGQLSRETRRLDLSFEMEPIAVMQQLSSSEKDRIDSLVLIEVNIANMDDLLKELDNLKNLQTIYLEIHQKGNQSFIDHFKTKNVEIKCVNSGDEYEVPFLTVSQMEFINKKLIASSSNKGKTASDLEIIRLKTITMLLSVCSELSPDNPLFFDLLKLCKYLHNVSNNERKLWCIVDKCLLITDDYSPGNKYDNAIYVLENIANYNGDLLRTIFMWFSENHNKYKLKHKPPSFFLSAENPDSENNNSTFMALLEKAQTKKTVFDEQFGKDESETLASDNLTQDIAKRIEELNTLRKTYERPITLDSREISNAMKMSTAPSF